MNRLATVLLILSTTLSAQAPVTITQHSQFVCWDTRGGVVILHEDTKKKCVKNHDHWIPDRTGEIQPNGEVCANAGCSYLQYPEETKTKPVTTYPVVKTK
jgi:hypothetical protein